MLGLMRAVKDAVLTLARRFVAPTAATQSAATNAFILLVFLCEAEEGNHANVFTKLVSSRHESSPHSASAMSSSSQPRQTRLPFTASKRGRPTSTPATKDARRRTSRRTASSVTASAAPTAYSASSTPSLLRAWGVARTHTPSDAWGAARHAHGFTLDSRDVGHVSTQGVCIVLAAPARKKRRSPSYE